MKIKIHDTLFKELAEYKEEISNFIEDFINKKIRKEDLEIQSKEYRLKEMLVTRNIDVLYKVKNEEVFIILEHQSTVDYIMGQRMNEYCLAVVSNRTKFMVKSKNIKAPVIYPIVLNTSSKKWDAPMTIEQIEYNCYNIPKLNYPKYIVVDINDYTVEELLSKRTGMGLAMAFERIRTENEMKNLLEILKHRKINRKEKRAMKKIVDRIDEIMPSLIRNLSKEEVEKFKNNLKNIMKKGSDFIPNFDKVLEKSLEEMRIKGVEEGKEEIVLQTTKEMLKNKMEDKEIMKYMHISKEKLEELKLQIA